MSAQVTGLIGPRAESRAYRRNARGSARDSRRLGRRLRRPHVDRARGVGPGGRNFGLAHRRALVPIVEEGRRPEQVLGASARNTMIVTIDRTDYWQCAFVIGKGGIGRVRAEGLEAFKAAVADGARFCADRWTNSSPLTTSSS